MEKAGSWVFGLHSGNDQCLGRHSLTAFPPSTVLAEVGIGRWHDLCGSFVNLPPKFFLADKDASLPLDPARLYLRYPLPRTMVFQLLPSVVERAEETVATLFSFITAQGSSDYLGERVSQLEHSLQAAHLAQEAGADEETILGALLHDVGRFIPQSGDMPKMIAPGGTFIGRASHEVLGERYLRELGFSEKICQLVGAHVMAKRYLTAVDAKYYDGLSKLSKQTLKFQVSLLLKLDKACADMEKGGIFDSEQVKDAQKDPWLEQKLAVRRWDDLAKVPNMEVKPLSHYEDMTINSLLSKS